MKRTLIPDRALTADNLARVAPALRLLHSAAVTAALSEHDVWQFAVELHLFLAEGIAAADLRLLLAAGLIEHAVEQPARNGTRAFRRITNLSIPKEACFVLTDSGARFVDQIIASDPTFPVGPRETLPYLPKWDAARRELRRGRAIIKRFRWKAANQELILSSFQELAWTSRIDDPLPPVRGLELSARLRDTVRTLNHNQSAPTIRFTTDGTGRGVLWRWMTPDQDG